MEIRAFKPHQNLIYHLVESQGATLKTAIRELVQNAFDAGATVCAIDLNDHNFTVSDNGKGFASRQEVEDFFETFGQPHTENTQHKFGRFRMGRSQIMAFARTQWHSNQFVMDVDFQQMGLEYVLQEGESSPGCCIKGAWYKVLGRYDLIDLKKDLAEHFAYLFAMDVHLNGERISKHLDEVQVTAQTDDLYLIEQPGTHRLQIYNLGVLVPGYYNFKYSVSGVIVSKAHLKLDISRTDIDSHCPVWNRIRLFLKANYSPMRRLLTRKKPLTVEDIQTAYQYIADGEIELKALWSMRLFRDQHHTKRYSLEELTTGPRNFTFVVAGQEALADRIGQRGIVRMLSSEFLGDFFPANDPAGVVKSLFERIDRLADDDRNEHQYRIRNMYEYFTPFSTAARSVSTDHEFIDEASLTPTEQCAVKAIRSGYKEALYKGRNLTYKGYRYPLFSKLTNRQFVIGRSSTASGWTDGSTFVALNKNLLIRLDQGLVHCDFIAAVIVHEWCHTEENPDEHNAEFYRLYHQLTLDLPLNLITGLSRSINRHYAKYLLNAQLPVPAAVDKDVRGGASQYDKLKKLHKHQEKELKELKYEGDEKKMALYDLLTYLEQKGQLEQLPETLSELVEQYKNQESFFPRAAEHRRFGDIFIDL